MSKSKAGGRAPDEHKKPSRSPDDGRPGESGDSEAAEEKPRPPWALFVIFVVTLAALVAYGVLAPH